MVALLKQKSKIIQNNRVRKTYPIKDVFKQPAQQINQPSAAQQPLGP